jgi:hypothetical protein
MTMQASDGYPHTAEDEFINTSNQLIGVFSTRH